ncbi:MAG: hypothetical protein M1832_000967 [Thelocarpon impressellum]|nr:MAG: hypothetical protein M1832_000967 [Thelocarpon impressellum]
MSGPRRKAPARPDAAPHLQYKTPSPSKLPRQHPHPHTSSRMVRRGPWILGGVAVYGVTAYGAYLYTSYRSAVAASQTLDVPADVSDRYDATAAAFDADVDLTETLTGITFLRKRLARRARGDVLEVAAGTGRNLGYYDMGKVKSLTLLDLSAPMLDRARARWAELRPKGSPTAPAFVVQDAADPVPSPPAGGYDTVVQTMGLCSTPAPVRLLQTLGRETEAQSGRILLLEHGRSHYAWLNAVLDGLAPAHADRHGCWWNRDVGRIVQDSGLEVVEARRYHLGTTWWFELRPKARRSEDDETTKP